MSTLMDQTKNKIWNVLQSILVIACCSSVGWMAQSIMRCERERAVFGSELEFTKERVDVLEQKGSRNLESYSKANDQRWIDNDNRSSRLETAILGLASVNGKLDSIAVKQEWMKETMGRVEAALEEHKKSTIGPNGRIILNNEK